MATPEETSISLMAGEIARLNARLASLTTVSDEDVGRVAATLVRGSEGSRALSRFRDLLFSHRHEIVRAALTAFVER